MAKLKKVFVDTNKLFPVLITPKGGTNYFFFNHLLPNFNIVTSEVVIKELDEILRSHLPHKEYRKAKKYLEKNILPNLTVVQTPETESLYEEFIPNKNDRKILRAALESCDILFTEDNHFLKVREIVEEIEILTIDEFESKYIKLHEEDNQ